MNVTYDVIWTCAGTCTCTVCTVHVQYVLYMYMADIKCHCHTLVCMYMYMYTQYTKKSEKVRRLRWWCCVALLCLLCLHYLIMHITCMCACTCTVHAGSLMHVD